MAYHILCLKKSGSINHYYDKKDLLAVYWFKILVRVERRSFWRFYTCISTNNQIEPPEYSSNRFWNPQD